MSLNTPGLHKTFIAANAIARYSVVKLDAGDNQVALATAVTDPLIGVSAEPADIAAGQRIDVIFAGIAEVRAGASITKGVWLTVHTNGTVKPATTTDERIGRALQAAVAGDVLSIEIIKN